MAGAVKRKRHQPTSEQENRNKWARVKQVSPKMLDEIIEDVTLDTLHMHNLTNEWYRKRRESIKDYAENEIKAVEVNGLELFNKLCGFCVGYSYFREDLNLRKTYRR
jgi:hypothetical protein